MTHGYAGPGGWTLLGNGAVGFFSAGGSWNLEQYYQTIQLADVDGDLQAELVARDEAGVFVFHFDRPAATWTQQGGVLGLFNDAPAGWNRLRRQAGLDPDGLPIAGAESARKVLTLTGASAARRPGRANDVTGQADVWAGRQ